MEKYIDYITSYFVSKQKPEFLKCESLAISKVNAFLGGNAIRSEQYYHIVVLNCPPPALSESGGKTMYFRKNHFILLPPEREYHLEGGFAFCQGYYYLIIKKHLAEQIAKEFFGENIRLDIMQRKAQAQTLNLVNQIYVELQEKKPGYEAVSRCLLSLLLAYIFRGAEMTSSNTAAGTDGITKAHAYITAYYNSDIDIGELAGIANISKYHFMRQFKKAMGYTPHQYIKTLRLQKSFDLLLNTGLSVSEISRICGFLTPSHFASDFKKSYQITPTQCRAMWKNGTKPIAAKQD